MPAKHAVLTDLHNDPRLEARIGLGTDSADCPERTILKLAKVFNEVYENAKDALQGANSIEQVKSVKRWDNDWKSSLKAMVTLTRTRSMELLSLARRSRRWSRARSPIFKNLGQVGRRPFQPTPANYTVSVAQLSHKHMIDVFEDDGEIKTLMTANEVNIGNKDADLLKNGFIIKVFCFKKVAHKWRPSARTFVLAELKISGQLFQGDRVMAGAGVRRRQRSLRSMWRHAETAIKMAFATCVHYSVQTGSHGPNLAVFDQGLQVGVLWHHDFDVDSYPGVVRSCGFRPRFHWTCTCLCERR